ncbi:MAG: class I tRNA ligase family protein [Planctomycetes bacterium]|nr:class I tRNA ligase family protein [Planctomycetota bacterium]
MRKIYYITTPLYYVNAEPHIGTAYTTVAADVLARYKRLAGYEVFFLTGTDEHGLKIARTAKEAGLSPKEFVDKLVPKFKQAWQQLGISYDYFIRTTDPSHEESVKALFRKVIDKGDIYKGKYSGWYCPPCERYISLKDSPDKSCPVCKRPGEFFEEDNYFFKLSKYQAPLLKHFKDNPAFVEPSFRYNEILNRLESGIEDISVSRLVRSHFTTKAQRTQSPPGSPGEGRLARSSPDTLCRDEGGSAFDWGIPLPTDPSQVIWVWFDALINYISAIGYPAKPDVFNKFWPADVHLIAKDILWFHSVIWPAMLMAAGIPLPKKVFAHGWWTMNRDKISKSKGNAVYPAEVIKQVGVDGLRYFLLREMPFGLDGDFSEAALINRYNNDLGNDLGNLVLRTLTMIEKYYDGKIPSPAGAYEPVEELRQTAEKLAVTVPGHLDKLAFSLALEDIWSLIHQANKTIDSVKPWALAKAKSEHLPAVLYGLAETLRIVAVHLAPFMPTVSKSILAQLGLADDIRLPSSAGWGKLPVGTQTAKSQPLFQRIELPV